MAVTGILLVLFLIAHMLGNLKVFTGETSFDHYAHWLRDIGTPLLPGVWFLWIQRTVLAVAVSPTSCAATVLAMRARAARPVKYAHRKKVHGSYAARTMRWGGVIILLFVIYHILDLTTGTLNPVGRRQQPVRQRRRRLRAGALVRHALLHPRDRRARLPPAPRRVQRVPQPRPADARGRAPGRVPQRWSSPSLLCAGYLVVPFAVLTGLVS